MTLELAEIQGIVLSGYGDRPCARFVPFAIDDVPKARSWLADLTPRIQYGSFLRTKKSEPPFLAPVCLNVGFTHEGLARLGLARDTLLGFSGSFRGGMAAPHRARQLGDDGASAPEHWTWGGPRTDAVHGILMVYAGSEDGDPDEDERCVAACTREVSAANGLRAITVRETLPMQRGQRAEHFGFADGISNPKPESLAHPGDARDVIADGEVVLGYPNAYGKLGLSPLVTDDADAARRLPPSRLEPSRRDFGRNGSYLVFRELSQDVGAFWRFMEQAAAALPDRPGAVWLASRMIGRWPSGLPVTPHDPLAQTAGEQGENAFDYHARDPLGTGCPIGAHIRRVNPRDTRLPIPHESADAGGEAERKRLVDRHRLVRRGRSYGPRRSDTLDLEAMKQDDGVARGLHFLCVVANLRRQFEFVQGTWIVNPNFAGLSRDPDPLLASQRTFPFEASSFVLPGCPARFVDGVPRFVEMRGGAYFFLPSRSALAYLAALGAAAPARLVEPLDPVDDALAQELEVLERRKVARDHTHQAPPKRARRAFHPRAHGIVRGTLEVDRDLPASFHSGLFRPGAHYPAWLRFSSGRFRETRDDRRDLHGLAIKLMNVPTLPRASNYEAHTHDFVLVDAPRLAVGTLAAAVALERALLDGPFATAAHFARHPGELRRLLAMGSIATHPLARSYNSITPFAYGSERAVRWVVRLAKGEQLVPSERSPTALRDALGRQLAQGPVRLELCVQNRGSRPLPLDDATVDWRIPEERVATLTLHAEGFGEPAQEELGEQLAFNPWNALLEHRPLGALNAARKLVYRSLAELRRELSGKLPREPRPWDEPS